MMYRVEFNDSGFYASQGIWTCLDGLTAVKADDPQEAIELAIDWLIDEQIQYGDQDHETAEKQVKSYAWRAAAVINEKTGEYSEFIFWEGDLL